MIRTLSAAAVALSLVTTPALAGNTIEQDFVALGAILYSVSAKCPGFEHVDNGPRLAAERKGVDIETLGPAIVAGTSAIFGRKYESADLIPWVTKQLNVNYAEMVSELGKGDKYFCKRYGTVMVNVGYMKKAEGKKGAKDDGSF